MKPIVLPIKVKIHKALRNGERMLLLSVFLFMFSCFQSQSQSQFFSISNLKIVFTKNCDSDWIFFSLNTIYLILPKINCSKIIRFSALHKQLTELKYITFELKL